MAPSASVNRTLLGWLAIGILGTAIFLILTDREQADGLGGILIRIGIVVGAFWLLGPKQWNLSLRSKFSWWLIGGMTLAIVIMSRVRIPLVYFVLAATLFVGLLWFARPKKKAP
ncbi:hypothetical protein Spb1_18630 [Planctopirus ephydatiae]|jgi:hypothetical protein|uniref:Uncharacterized protein n=1 Tax=Planctopirus ephydatiae TaxID=2528019 RepID=A0A518GMR7_9PLAN|nr:hypothetical protein [Planctopirus ephydatiae]QDV29943.1 hypothetical protein Spb1_18630 [Planctopirus ephydatiae]